MADKKYTHRCGACEKRFTSGKDLIEHLEACPMAAIFSETIDDALDAAFPKEEDKEDNDGKKALN